MSTQLRQLLELINGAAATLEKNCSVNGTRIPDPHEPFYRESEAFRTDPVAENAANIIGAAALQLAALVLPPHLVMFNIMGGRTIGQFDELFRWKIVAVRQGGATRPFALAVIEAVPTEYEREQLQSRL